MGLTALAPIRGSDGHTHAVNPVTTPVEEIKSKLRKRAREEVTPVPTLYNEALVELSTQPDCSDVAPTLPTYSLFKSSCTEVDERGSLHSLKQELRSI